MVRYLVELYLPKEAADDPASATRRARAAATKARREGARVRFLRSIVVPEDETWFLVYDAPTLAAVERALEEAALTGARITEAIEAN